MHLRLPEMLPAWTLTQMLGDAPDPMPDQTLIQRLGMLGRRAEHAKRVFFLCFSYNHRITEC